VLPPHEAAIAGMTPAQAVWKTSRGTMAVRLRF
jgi:hypothetical protein